MFMKCSVSSRCCSPAIAMAIDWLAVYSYGDRLVVTWSNYDDIYFTSLESF